MELSKEILKFIEDVTPGNFAVYRLDGGTVHTVCASPSLPALNGMTSGEYAELTRENAAALVMPDDLPGLMEAVRYCAASKTQLDYYYRVAHKKNGFDWVHANARVCGELDGKPVLLVVYSNASVETNIYQKLLNRSNAMIFVCDCKTHKLLYANEAAVRNRKGSGGSMADAYCYSYIQGRDTPCSDCFLGKDGSTAGTLSDKRYDPNTGKWESVTGEFVNWCGREAFVHYIRDITESENKHQEIETLLAAERNLVRSVQILNSTEPLDKRMDKLLAFVGACYQADRAYIFEIDEGSASASNTYEWCRQGVAPQKDNLQRTNISYIRPWLPYFDKKSAVVVPDVRNIRAQQPDVYEIMSRQDIRSYMEAPLITSEKLTGFIGVDNPLAIKAVHSDDMLLSLAYSISNAMERFRSEKLLLSANRRYVMAVQGAGLRVWEYDVQRHRILNADVGYGQYKVPPVVENVPMAMLPKVLAADRPRLLDMYRRIDEGEASVSGDFWMRWDSLTPPRCERVYYCVEKDACGKPSIAFGIGMDVTSQKLEQEKFHQSMQAMLAANPEALGTIQLNLTRNICGTGRATSLQSVSFCPEESADEFFASLIDLMPRADDRRAFSESFSRRKLLAAFAEGRNTLQFDYRRRGLDGRHFWSRTYVSMLANPDTRDVEAVLYSTDISREKLREDIFRIITNQEYDLLALLHVSDETIEFLYLSGGIPEKYHEILKRSAKRFNFSEIRSHAAKNWVDAADRDRYMNEGCLDSVKRELDKNGHYEFTICEHFQDLQGAASYRKFQHYYLDEDKNDILIIESDVTETYRRQQQELAKERALRQQATSANAAKTDFLSRMSHDIRTPLNGIMGMVHIANGQQNPPQTADCLSKIDTSSRFLLGLVSDILDMTKAESGKFTLHPEPYFIEDFDRYISSVIRPLCDEKNQKLTFKSDTIGGIVLLMDILRVNQIYFNLLSNAVKYTPEGGSITVTTKDEPLYGHKIRVVTQVSDSGIGMSGDFQKVLFEPFTQENRSDISEMRGSGLGLAIVKKIVDAMDGTITVRSELGKGTTFTLSLDYDYVDRKSLQKPAPGGAASEADDSVLAGRHVLLCEDHPMNQEIARALLEEKKLLPEIAENGQKGVEMFARSLEGFYSVVLMDIRMPVMDGYAATRAIRALPRKDAATVPIIAMTADAFSEDVKKCLEAGMNSHIAKPIDPQELCDKLCKAIA